jgi:hypothetical protein
LSRKQRSANFPFNCAQGSPQSIKNACIQDAVDASTAAGRWASLEGICCGEAGPHWQP